MTNLTAAETITEITNRKILEVYRKSNIFSFARSVDDHLADLSTRIIEALELLPARPAPENLLLKLETTVGEDPGKLAIEPGMGRTDQVLKKMLNMPPGELDTKESNETPATDQEEDPKASCPADTGVDKPGLADGGADPKPGRHPVADEIEAYMEDNDLTVWQAAKQLGMSGETLLNAVGGFRTPRSGTVEKIRAAIKKTKPKKKPTPNVSHPPAHPPSKPLAPKPNGKGPGQFVQTKLATWMGRERLGVKDAAARLGITEAHIRAISVGNLPDRTTLKFIARHVTELQPNMGYLLTEARHQENGRGVST